MKDQPYTGPWYDQRNERRRQKYATDPAYREQMKDRARKAYRDRAHGDDGSKKSDLYDPRNSLKKLAKLGTIRDVDGIKGKGLVRALTFTKLELSRVLGRSRKQLYAWVNRDTLPSPIYQAGGLNVYLECEVVAIIEAIGEHLATVTYFRDDHDEQINAVHTAVITARKEAKV